MAGEGSGLLLNMSNQMFVIGNEKQKQLMIRSSRISLLTWFVDTINVVDSSETITFFGCKGFTVTATAADGAGDDYRRLSPKLMFRGG